MAKQASAKGATKSASAAKSLTVELTFERSGKSLHIYKAAEKKAPIPALYVRKNALEPLKKITVTVK